MPQSTQLKTVYLEQSTGASKRAITATTGGMTPSLVCSACLGQEIQEQYATAPMLPYHQNDFVKNKIMVAGRKLMRKMGQ